MFGNSLDIPFFICAQLVLFGFLTFSKQKIRVWDRIGFVWIVLIGFAISRRIFHLHGNFEELSYFIKFVFYPLAYGPCFYLYTKYLTDQKTFRKLDLIHFIPFFLFGLAPFSPEFIISTSLDTNSKPSFLVTFFVICSSFSLIVYAVFTQRLLNQYHRSLEDHFSYPSVKMTIYWLGGCIYLYLIILILQFFFVILEMLFHYSFHLPQAFTTLLFVVYFYLVNYFLLRQDIIIRTSNTNVILKKGKYSKSGLTSEKVEKIHKKLISFMEESKIYLKNDLNIEDLSRELHIQSFHLSQVLNQSIGKNFFLFVNEYRVTEVLNRLNDPKYKDYSILRLALDSGFNSKSSFNAIFRKITGRTPNEFRS